MTKFKWLKGLLKYFTKFPINILTYYLNLISYKKEKSNLIYNRSFLSFSPPSPPPPPKNKKNKKKKIKHNVHRKHIYYSLIIWANFPPLTQPFKHPFGRNKTTDIIVSLLIITARVFNFSKFGEDETESQAEETWNSKGTIITVNYIAWTLQKMSWDACQFLWKVAYFLEDLTRCGRHFLKSSSNIDC